MPARILSSVLFPAPLRPMTPTFSPRAISNETFAQAPVLPIVDAAAEQRLLEPVGGPGVEAVALADVPGGDDDGR